MKKEVTVEKTFCDFCEEPGWAVCMVCGKDLCPAHRVQLGVYLDRQEKGFNAALCPQHGLALLPLLEVYVGESKNWQRAGRNPEFNEARLLEIISYLGQWTGRLV